MNPNDLPVHIIEAAQHISAYMKRRHIELWQLEGICDRALADWSVEEIAAIKELAREKDMPIGQVLRQALRLYQLEHHRQITGRYPFQPAEREETASPAPVVTAYSREQLTVAMARWLRQTYGSPSGLDADARDRWHERMGLLFSFIHDHFPPSDVDA